MLCPKCGAYSPYNTDVCNRCGARLAGETEGEPVRRKSGYYRNASKSGWEKKAESMMTSANDWLDSASADKNRKLILIAILAVAAALMLTCCIGCVSCMCSSCAAEADPSAPSADVSDSDSGAAVVLPGDAPSPSDADDETPSAPSQPAIQTPVSIPDDRLVFITDYIPTVYVELKYATADNFTGSVVYSFDSPQLRYGTVRKLAAAQGELNAMGYSLKIWDGYRPLSAQALLWESCPDPALVSNPATGYCGHSRGHTVDVTLVTAGGMALEMPSGFDDFTALGDRDYSDVSEEAAANAKLLEEIMTSHGFTGYAGEWWHFTDTEEYPLIEE